MYLYNCPPRNEKPDPMKNLNKVSLLVGHVLTLLVLLNSCNKAPIPTGSIAGKVYFTGTTVSIPDVRVEVDGAVDITSEIGYYSVSNIPIGKHFLNVSKDGFNTVEEIVEITERATKLNIELTSDLFTSSFIGQITGEQSGQPQSGITIMMLNPDDTPSSLQTVTGIDGDFIIEHIPRGDRTFAFLINGTEIERKEITVESWDYVLDFLLAEPNIPIEFTDERDGNTYLSMLIGKQTWMLENLRYLPAVHAPSEESRVNPMYYVYWYWGDDFEEAKDSLYYKEFGVAYNYSAAVHACPDGWHLPTDEEWNELQMFLGMSSYESSSHGYQFSGNVGFKLKSSSGWPDNGNGDNSSQMNIFPAGGKMTKGSFYLPIVSSHWTKTAYDEIFAWTRSIHPDKDAVNRTFSDKIHGHYIRCMKDR